MNKPSFINEKYSGFITEDNGGPFYRVIVYDNNGLGSIDMNVTVSAVASIETSGLREEDVHLWLWNQANKYLEDYSDFCKVILTSDDISNKKILPTWEELIERQKTNVLKIGQLIEELQKVHPDTEVYVNHHINTDKGHGYHKTCSRATEVIINKGEVIIDSEFALIKANVNFEL
jgi:hypothetical protein